MSAVLSTVAPVAHARPIVQGDDVTWDLSGYFKNFASATYVDEIYRDLNLRNQNTFWDNASRARVRSDLRLGDPIDIAAHYEISYTYGDTRRATAAAEDLAARLPGGDALLEALFPEAAPSRLFDLSREDTDDDWILRHGFDRLFIRYRQGPTDLTLGRAAITWGPGYFWNPTDYFAPFSPTEIDKEEKVGVDMARVYLSLPHTISLDMIAAPVRRADGVDNIDYDRSGAAARASINAMQFDWAVSGGYLYDKSVVGFDIAGPAWQAGLRAAATYTQPDDLGDRFETDPYVRAVVNVDYAFAWRWNPYVLGEYHYNGLGKDDPEDYGELLQQEAVQRASSRGEVVNAGRHYAAFNITLQPHPLWTTSDSLIVNFSDGSVFYQTFAAWSILQSLDLQFGANLTFGPVPSEFGGYELPLNGKSYGAPDSGFAYLKYYW
ncbi:MAG: hypothetical protein H6684_16105 [Deltaproteobacteria bacterium]|nr:hypothetical protein [Deltaproteobacteria bacterium]MCB9490255.1 hypothetical protein [Deltaproteobacteria bacterium]